MLNRAWGPAGPPCLHRPMFVQAVGEISQRSQTWRCHAPSSLYGRLLGSQQSPCRAYSSSSSSSHAESASSVHVLLRIGKAIVRAAAAIVAAALLTVAALPAVLSTHTGLQKAVQLANYITPAQVSVGQVQLPGTTPFLPAASSLPASSHMLPVWQPSATAQRCRMCSSRMIDKSPVSSLPSCR